MTRLTLTRRALLGAGVAAVLPWPAMADATMRTCPIPVSGEALPMIGLGTARVFDVGAGEADRAPRRNVLQELFNAGGTLIDSSPMYGRAESVAGDLATDIGVADKAFMATKVWTDGAQAGEQQMAVSARRLKKSTIDLMQIHNMRDWQVHLETLRRWKEDGRIRYIGITHSRAAAFGKLESVLETEQFDFVQFNYSLGERQAEARLLPLCAERGIATLINRPFMRGELFRRFSDETLPGWAAEADIASWGQFFLKFVISHPAVTCAIPATAKPDHMIDNAGAGFGRLPDAELREKMLALLAA
jgi:diketogulonate reductase-like aldo/keto reductase